MPALGGYSRPVLPLLSAEWMRVVFDSLSTGLMVPVLSDGRRCSGPTDSEHAQFGIQDVEIPPGRIDRLALSAC